MKRSVVLVSLILATLFTPASAANVTVIAEGVFSEYTDPDGLLPFSEPAPGTIFRMVLTYDSDSWKFSPLPELGIFAAISNASLMIGSNTFVLGLRNNEITILNDAVGTEGGYVDFWGASMSTETPTELPNQTLLEGGDLVLVNQAASTPVPPLASTDLVQPSWPGGWELGFIEYRIGLRTTTTVPSQYEKLASAKADITSIEVVPVPAAAWLFGSALSLLGWMTRRIA